MTAVMPELRAITDDDLLALYQGEDEGGSRAALSEAARRDRLTLAKRARGAERATWEDGAYAQYLDAERECRGNLVNDRGVTAGVSDWSLWSGPASRALSYATEELRNYWDAHPRVTVTEYRRQVSDGHRMQRHERDRASATNSNPATGREDTMSFAGSVAGAMVRDAARESARVTERRQSIAERAQARVGVLSGQVHAPGTVSLRDSGTVEQRQLPPVDGGRLLTLVKMYLSQYVSFPSDAAANTVVAWIAHAVARQRDDKGIGPLIWRATPRLLVTSRYRGSGKSTLLDLIVILTGSSDGKVPKITPRAIAHVLGELQETVVIDEAKTVFGAGQKSLELQGILLAGYTRRSNYVINAGSKNRSIPLFGPVAYAGKDELITDTGSQLGDLLDRSVTIRMRPPSRPMPELDEQADADGEKLALLLVKWTDSSRDRLVQAAHDISAEDREAAEEGANLRTPQIWRPLKAVCRVAGGDWPELIDHAARCGEEDEMAEAMAEMENRARRWQAAAAPDEEAGWVESAPGYDEEDE